MRKLDVQALRKVYSETVGRDFKIKKFLRPSYSQSKGRVLKCDLCGEYFKDGELTVHHVNSVIPPQITHKEISFELFNRRLYCSQKDLQLLCLHCHQDEGHKEIRERIEWEEKKKFLVCRSRVGGKMTVNPVADLINLDQKWEVMEVALTRSVADNLFRKWRKS